MNRSPKVRKVVVSTLAVALAASGLTACKKSPATGDAAATGSQMAPMQAAAKSEGGGETPEAVVARMKKAAADKNMPEVVACLAPKARQEMTAAMYLGATMMVAFSQMGAQMGGAMMEGMAGMADGAAEVTAEAKQKADAEAEKMKGELAKLADSYNTVMKKYGLPQLPKEGEPEPAEPSKEEMDKVFANIDHGAFITDVMALLDSMPGEKQDPESPFPMKDGALENLKIEGDSATGTVGGETLRFAKVDGRWYLDADPMGGGEMPGAESAGGTEAKQGV